MANQPESGASYPAGVYQIEVTDFVTGGVGGLSNTPLLQLASRTAYLKSHMDAIETGSTTIIAPVGAVGAPGMTFVADLDTGWWHPAANTMAGSVGGVEIIRFASGLVTVNAIVKSTQGNTDGFLVQPTTATQAGWYRIANTGGNHYFGADDSTGSQFNSVAGNYGQVIWRPATVAFAIARAGGLTDLTFDSSGNAKFYGKVGFGMAATNFIDATQTQNAASIVQITNTNTGTAGQAVFRAMNNTALMEIAMLSSGYNTTGVLVANYGILYSNSSGISICSQNGPILFADNGTVEGMRLSGGKLGFGMVPIYVIDVTVTQNAPTLIRMINGSAGSAAFSGFQANNSASSNYFIQTGTGFGGTGMQAVDMTLVQGGGAGGVGIATSVMQPIRFGINLAEVARFGTDGSLIVNTQINGGWSADARIAAEVATATAISANATGSGGAAFLANVDNVAGKLVNLYYNHAVFVGSITTDGTDLFINSAATARVIILGGGNGNNNFIMRNNGNSTPYGAVIQFPGAAPNNTTQYFLACQDSGAQKAIIYSNGNMVNTNNSYGAISMRELKQDFSSARSQWDNVKALSNAMERYRLKSDVKTLGKKARYHLGLVTDVVKEISPGLVGVDGDGIEHLAYSVLQLKGFKATGEILNWIDDSAKPAIADLQKKLQAANDRIAALEQNAA